jgi:TRAP-type uncharacterized transport system fused permease subunit
MKTAMYALRIGMVKFAIPFVFAYYPVPLIVEESGAAFEWDAFLFIQFRLFLLIYLISSAVIAFDMRRLPIWEIALRPVLAVLVIFVAPQVHWPATVAALAFIVWHNARFGRKSKTGGAMPA